MGKFRFQNQAKRTKLSFEFQTMFSRQRKTHASFDSQIIFQKEQAFEEKIDEPVETGTIRTSSRIDQELQTNSSFPETVCILK